MATLPFRYVCMVAALMIVAGSGSPATAASADPSFSLKEIERFDAATLAEERQVCAMGKMGEVITKARAHRLVKSELPDADLYCRKVISETVRQKRGADLYVRLALQEKGLISLDFASQAKYLQNNEAGRTMAAVLQAANAGQTSYTSVTSTSRTLPCALALDAGATWAASAPNAVPPVSFSLAEAHAVARECYLGVATTLKVQGKKMPASKAGLVVGAWLARNS